jgi:hypothetical protein
VKNSELPAIVALEYVYSDKDDTRNRHIYELSGAGYYHHQIAKAYSLSSGRVSQIINTQTGKYHLAYIDTLLEKGAELEEWCDMAESVADGLGAIMQEVKLALKNNQIDKAKKLLLM